MPENVVSKMTSKYQITVPAHVRETLHLEKGDSLLFTLGDDGSVSVRKAVARDEAFARALEAALSEWASLADDEAYSGL